jgi:hypothetical protein
MIIGQPKKLSPAFNNLYIYATTSNINEPNFKYLVQVGMTNPQLTSLELISQQSIRPRYGDDFLEYNFNKVVQSKLGDLTDDIDFNDVPQTIFMNTESSGVDILIGIDDTYQYSWDFSGATTSFFGDISMIGSEEPLYVAGDIINITGLASYFTYTAIVNGTLNYAEFTLTEPHNLSVGDFVLVQQNSPFTYPIYTGYFEVLFAGNPLAIGIDMLFQGASDLPQTGQLIYNDNLDGPAIVTLAGGSFPNYFVDINKGGTTSIFGVPIVLGATQGGTTRFIDSRLSSFPNSITSIMTIFNGAMDRKDWLEYNTSDYSTIVDGFDFLTDLPNNWTTKLDNDIYLNFWNYGLAYDYLDLILTTKDCNGNVIDEYMIPYDTTTASTVQTINVGPSHINEICPTVEKLLNSGFWDTSAWILTTTGTATGSITAGSLRYNATFPASVGRVRATQNNVLTVGEQYTLCFDVTQNVNCDVQFNNGIGVLATASQTGEQCFTFTASSANFIVSIDGLSSFPVPSCKIDYVSVTQEVCDMIDCDICSYDIQLDVRARELRNQIYEFEFEQPWQIYNFLNANTYVDTDLKELVYTDLVEFGGIGGSIVAQECVYTPGQSYNVRVNINNNSNVLVQAGETGTLFPIGTTGSTGPFSFNFTASNSTFVLTMSGVDAFGTNGATINDIEVILNGTFTASSQIYNFEVDCECEGRYTNYPIIFKDRMGSFVTYNFDLNNKQRVFKTSENYNNFVGNFSDANVSTCGKGGYRYSLNDAGTQVFSTILEEEWELNADEMTEEESIFFEQLITSPRAAIKIDGNYYAIYIKDNQYERVRKNNQKMIYHKLFIRFANNNPIQML